MKRYLLVALAFLLALVLGVSQANADRESDAVADVVCEIVPNIAVMPDTPFVDVGDVQSGEFEATIVFRIDANTQTCRFKAMGSNLYKGDDPTEPTVLPIPLIGDAVFSIENGDPTGDQGNSLRFGTAGDPIGDFPTLQTGWIEFESSQNNHFSQLLTLVVTYDQDDPEKPMGEYSGKVKLLAQTRP